MTPLILCLLPSSAGALSLPLALLGVALGLGVLLIGDSRRGERCEEQPPAPRPRWLPHLHDSAGEVTRVAADGYPWLEPDTCARADRCPGRPDIPEHRERLFSSVSDDGRQGPPGRPPLSKLLERGDTISLSLDDVDCSPALSTTLPATRRAQLAHDVDCSPALPTTLPATRRQTLAHDVACSPALPTTLPATRRARLAHDLACSPALPTTLPATRRARLAPVEEDRWRQAPPTAELQQLALRLHKSPALDFLLYGEVRGR